MTQLYDAILTRDYERVATLVRNHCAQAPAEARDNILRFAVLAFAPSLHSRSTMYAAVAITDLFDSLETPCALVVQCALYAAESRIPWGEAPVTDPPKFPVSFIADDATIDDAISNQDIHEAERWLAALLESDHVATPLFDAAARHSGEEGHGFSTAAVAWRIAQRFPPQVRFAVFRTCLLEWLQARQVPEEGTDASPADCMQIAVKNYVASRGRIDLFQPLVLADAISKAEEIVGEAGRYGHLLRRYVREDGNEGEDVEIRGETWSEEQLAYRYAIDYATFLQSVALSRRLKQLVGDEMSREIPAAALHALESSEGFEEWSFA